MLPCINVRHCDQIHFAILIFPYSTFTQFDFPFTFIRLESKGATRVTHKTRKNWSSRKSISPLARKYHDNAMRYSNSAKGAKETEYTVY